MKAHIKVEANGESLEEFIEAATAEDLFAQFRGRTQARLPFVKRQVVKLLSDREFMRRAVEEYNTRFGKSEPPPASAEEFLAFGQRAGYVILLDVPGKT